MDAVCCNRICSWAKFKERRTGTSFFIPTPTSIIKARRQERTPLFTDQEDQGDRRRATVVTGDFNAVPDAEPIRLIHESGLLLDSYEVTEEPPYGTVGTFNSYRLDSPVKNRIDYIWVTHNVKVKKYGVLNDLPYFRFPSDHFPVMIKAEIPKKK